MNRPVGGGRYSSMLLAAASSLYWMTSGGSTKRRGGGFGAVSIRKQGIDGKLDAAAIAHAKKKIGNALKGGSSGVVMATSWFGGDSRTKKKMKCMISEEHIDRITTLVNELVDLDFFDEDSEQRIFDDLIRKIVFTLEDSVTPRAQK